MKITGKLLCFILVCLLFPATIYGAEKAKGKEEALPEVVVESERLVEDQASITVKSEGLPAEVNIVTKEDLKKTPYTGNYLDMLVKVPGLYISKMALQCMGDNIGMRGFSGSHSREVAFYIDGMPMNFLDFYHGVPDFDWLIPEMIERIEVIKGPFSALYGDQALAGVINIITKNSDPSPSLGAFGGTYGTARGVGVISDPSWSKSLGNVTPFLVWEGFTRYGYRDNSRYNRGQLFNKFTVPLWNGNLSARFHYAARTFGSPGPLVTSEIKSGLRNRRSVVNDTDGGDAEMIDVVVNYAPKGGEAGFHGSLYYGRHVMTQAFTTQPRTQAREDSYEDLLGWHLFYNYMPFEKLSLIVGNDLRYDQGELCTRNSRAYYHLLSVKYHYKFNYLSTGVFGQAQYKPFSFIKLVAGLRFDQFSISVDNMTNPERSGNGSPNIWSPKFGLVITPYKGINIYANQGRGFRAPGVDDVSPSWTDANFDLGISELQTWDVGINALLFNRLFINFDYFDTRYTGEQWENPDTGRLENMGTSKRTGIEVEAKIFLTKELTIYGSFTDVRARIKNPTTPGAYYIPGVPNNQNIVGFEFQKPWGGGDHQIGVDFYYRRISRRPVDSSGTLIASQFDQYCTKLTYRYKKCTVSLDAFFSPRRYAGEAVSRRMNSLALTPLPLWEVLAGVRYQF